MNENMQNDIEMVLAEAQTGLLKPSMREEIIRDFGPIAGRIDAYKHAADVINIACANDAQIAAQMCDAIAADVKAVQKHELLEGVIRGFHSMHRRLTGLRDAFVAPMEASRKTIKQKVIAWQTAEAEKAERERARLQAIADEQARKERERLEAQAAKLKTPEKVEQRLEQAAQVVAPVIQVQAPKAAVKVMRVWVARVTDQTAFFAALAARQELAGYVTIETGKMQRAKAANPMIEIPGVEFRQEIR